MNVIHLIQNSSVHEFEHLCFINADVRDVAIDQDILIYPCYTILRLRNCPKLGFWTSIDGLLAPMSALHSTLSIFL
jgi:hypothetical protein